MFNTVLPYRYLLPTMYLFMTDIANPDLFVCCFQTWICIDITLFCDEQRQLSSWSAWPACPPQKTVNRDTIATAVTAPPLVGCVVWSPLHHLHQECLTDNKIYLHIHMFLQPPLCLQFDQLLGLCRHIAYT